jgi:hypothetical protein
VAGIAENTLFELIPVPLQPYSDSGYLAPQFRAGHQGDVCAQVDMETVKGSDGGHIYHPAGTPGYRTDSRLAEALLGARPGTDSANR